MQPQIDTNASGARRNFPWFATATAGLLVACSPHRGSIEGTVPANPPFVATATIQDLMDSEIDPAADFLWASVGTVITAAGVDNRQPRTDAQWQELRRRAITLVEATNLLVIPGRHVARTAFASEGRGVLNSEEIERKLAADPASFNAFALALRVVAQRELVAIDHRDVAALSAAGEAMDGACEACHVANWYPSETIPALPDFK
jgi:hypothetical protein